ncbi:MAG TPA: DinB family protein [Blastocatellia bacterium]|nr:DinB family protein [Blastocatellia bacterium]HMV85251.1 DinB family protein [Blastocatellia bacterium]HMX25795.1 DinB family protein [Blastocatellia bacterium]HMZ17890.1 DinB family protein [Blastocatellia bacterium]HNG33298.1 DinB family protein [Blastocatellia bacterium]
MFSEVLSRLETTEQALLQELAGVDLNHSPAPESWSGGQVLAHLIKTERYFHPLFAVAPALAKAPFVLALLDKLNIALCKLAGMKFIANGESQPRGLAAIQPGFKGRFVAPSFLRPAKKPYELAALLAERAQVRQKTLRHLNRIGLERLNCLRFSHPELGSLTLLEMFLFISKHEAWHTEQIKRLKSEHHEHQNKLDSFSSGLT